MGPVLNMTVGYLVSRGMRHLGRAASICASRGCPGTDARKSFENPTGRVAGMTKG